MKQDSKVCKSCGVSYFKKYSTSRKDWDNSKFCSRRCISKGRIPWNKNMKYSPAMKARLDMSGLSGKGNVPWNKGKHPEYMQGKNHHWYGKKFSDEYRKKLSAAHKGKMTKEKNPAWKGGVTSQNRIDRERFSSTIAKIVLVRDNYTCQICYQRGGNLHADHIKPWKEYPELRFDPDNCRTLCIPCHFQVTFKRKMPSTSTWGRADVTRATS